MGISTERRDAADESASLKFDISPVGQLD
jgi:hypothetical protein